LKAVLERYQSSTEPAVALVIEDDESTSAALREGLAGAGWSVIEAPCRQDAIDQLTQNHLGLIIVDLDMSDLNGFALIRALRRRADWKDVPVVALTSRDLTPSECERLEGLAQQIIHTDGDPQRELVAELRNITASLSRKTHAGRAQKETAHGQ
jgi:DNA-binding response OmpR family regulator